MDFVRRVLRFCEEQTLIPRGSRVICAVSGGADSVALLWCMYLAREELGLTLNAAHFNHGLRGEESQRDEDFVRALCDRYEIPLYLGRGEIRSQGRGMEDAARRARYDFFESLPSDALIATAHTADDNAETLLLRLIRGTGLRGLGAIAPKRGRFVRPMLRMSRQEVEAFLDDWGLRHVEDSSNHTDAYLRNRVRHRMVPLLSEENPRFVPNSCRMALSLRQDADYLDAAAENAYADAAREGGLSCDAVLRMHPAIRSRVLALFLKDCGLREPEADHLEMVEGLLSAANPSASVELPGSLTVERQYQLLRKRNPAEKLCAAALTLGKNRIQSWVIRVENAVFPQNIQKDPHVFYAPADAALTVRSRLPGDVMHRPGGHKSLKKLMIDCRIPASLRDGLPVFLMDGEICFVPGVGVSVLCKLQPGSPVLKIEIEEVDKNGTSN